MQPFVVDRIREREVEAKLLKLDFRPTGNPHIVAIDWLSGICLIRGIYSPKVYKLTDDFDKNFAHNYNIMTNEKCRHCKKKTIKKTDSGISICTQCCELRYRYSNCDYLAKTEMGDFLGYSCGLCTYFKEKLEFYSLVQIVHITKKTATILMCQCIDDISYNKNCIFDQAPQNDGSKTITQPCEKCDAILTEKLQRQFNYYKWIYQIISPFDLRRVIFILMISAIV